jgi:Zn-finger nucleic acid-binding protein
MTNMTNTAAGMPCPACKVALVMSERQGVEIDYCPQCRGVWLDRGELDKIIEKSNAVAPAAAVAAQPSSFAGQRYDDDRRPGNERRYDNDRRYGNDDDDEGGFGGRGGRGRSFLEQLFD